MLFGPERAREVLAQVDPAQMRWGWPIGLRDGALLALLAAGFTATELSRLCASAITMARGKKLLVAVRRQGVIWYAVLPADLGGRLLVWLTERRLWAENTPVFTGPQGRRLSPMAIYQILQRYRRSTPPRKPPC